jgi:hypothetical protein
MSNSEAQQIHLVADFAHGETVTGGGKSPRVEPLPVPTEPATVVTAPGEPPRLVPGNHPLTNGAVVVEQIVNNRRQLRLLAIHPGGEPLRVNGQLTPRVAVLGEKDSLQLADETTLHVTFFNRPYVGKPPSELVGRQCPVCRAAPFTEDSSVYICPCGVAMHISDGGDTESLQCARLQHACVACDRPITLKEGFTYWPDLVHA